MAANGYAVEPRSKVHRKAQRGAYDYATVHSILSSAPILHVSFAPTATDPFPTTLPMIGMLGVYPPPSDPSTSPQDIYLHGYVSNRLARLSHAAHVLDEETGLPVCVAGTLVDGLVLALAPFSHSMNYRSAVVHGYATEVTDAAEKLWAMEHVTDAVLRERWANARNPALKAEIAGTSILKVRVVSASAKVRAQGAGDDKADEEDEELKKRVWRGVVPVWMNYGQPIPHEQTTGEVPAYISKQLEGWNKEGEEKAVKAAKGG